MASERRRVTLTIDEYKAHEKNNDGLCPECWCWTLAGLDDDDEIGCELCGGAEDLMSAFWAHECGDVVIVP